MEGRSGPRCLLFPAPRATTESTKSKPYDWMMIIIYQQVSLSIPCGKEQRTILYTLPSPPPLTSSSNPFIKESSRLALASLSPSSFTHNLKLLFRYLIFQRQLKRENSNHARVQLQNDGAGPVRVRPRGHRAHEDPAQDSHGDPSGLQDHEDPQLLVSVGSVTSNLFLVSSRLVSPLPRLASSRTQLSSQPRSIPTHYLACERSNSPSRPSPSA